MKPYFDTNHAAGVLIFLAVLAWAALELAQYSRGRDRQGATRIGPRAFWPLAWASAIAANVMLYLAPHVAPAAAIRPGAGAFAAGMAILLGGIGLRGWSFKTLGRYFTFAVLVSPDQPVITSGPYRLLRHPGYTGLLLASAGVGLASANWVGLAAVTLLTLAVILWRITVEENALLATLGEAYRGYAAHHWRLLPLVW